MKFFNWTKILCKNYDETLWSNSEEEKLYNVLDLEEFENTFSAYQNLSKNPHENESLFSINNMNSLTSLNSGIDGGDLTDISRTAHRVKKVLFT